jgi:FkbM family methyltransferase
MTIRRAAQDARRSIFRPGANHLKRFLASRWNWPQTFVVDHFGEFRFRAASGTEVTRTLDYGLETESLPAFLFLLREDDIVWDIGASVGLFTVHTATKAKKVIAFEPDPPTLKRLQENVALNGLNGKVEFQGVALGETRGQLDLASDGLDGMAPALSVGQLARHKHSVSVPVETIDHLISRNVFSPSVIKMDIEGAELMALRGAQNLLQGPKKPRLLFIEVHPEFLKGFGSTAVEVTDLIVDAGYRIVATPQRAAQYHLIAFAG